MIPIYYLHRSMKMSICLCPYPLSSISYYNYLFSILKPLVNTYTIKPPPKSLRVFKSTKICGLLSYKFLVTIYISTKNSSNFYFLPPLICIYLRPICTNVKLFCPFYSIFFISLSPIILSSISLFIHPISSPKSSDII